MSPRDTDPTPGIHPPASRLASSIPWASLHVLLAVGALWTWDAVLFKPTVGTVDIGGLRDYRVVAPKEAMRRGVNVIRFEFSRAVSPAEVGVSPDRRPLAVMFDEIRLLRRPER